MLTYKYKAKSTLPRREFIVSCRTVYRDGTYGFGSWQVTAPDPVAAYKVIARHLTALLADDDRFGVECVREVTYVWHGDCTYRVPTITTFEV